MSAAELDEESPLAGRSSQAELDEDEEVPDWDQFAALVRSLKSNAVPAFIPKRGEKDYAPMAILADQQATALDTARRSFYEALEVGDVRQHSSKQHNRAVWHPSTARAAMDPAHMTSVHFRTMGRHHALRKQTELLPEEALYLVERGTLECWTEEGVPMSAQHAWTAMIGAEGLTHERYQIYAYLRRLGFAVLRADLASLLPEKRSPAAGPRGAGADPLSYLYTALQHPLTALVVRLRALLSLVPRLLGVAFPRLRCRGPLRRAMKPSSKPLVSASSQRSWNQIFSSLQVIPAGHDVPLSADQTGSLPPPAPDDPYRVFFHVYKPINKFRKTDPPPPDYYLAVIDVRKTPVFDLDQATRLLQSVPPTAPVVAAPHRTSPWLSGWRNLLPFWLGGLSPDKRTPRAPNPFPRLKTGRRNVIVAIVDSGTSSFLRVAEGEFGALPLLGSVPSFLP